MAKCKKHDMKIIEYSNYGYVSKCDECDKIYIYDSNDKTIVYQWMGVCLVIGFIIAIILEIFK